MPRPPSLGCAGEGGATSAAGWPLRGGPPHAFGHFGWGGSGAWADPQAELALGFIVNTGSGSPIGDPRITGKDPATLALSVCVDLIQRLSGGDLRDPLTTGAAGSARSWGSGREEARP